MILASNDVLSEVVDLKAAGLNPVLSAGGQGASTPAGAEGFVGDANAKQFDQLAAMYEMLMKILSSHFLEKE